MNTPDLAPFIDKNNPKIAIIGAGLAGLTVAYRLHQKGYHVSLFEARRRVGGRVHSICLQNFEGTYSVGELGGQNILDGGQARHFLNLAKEMELKVIEDKQEFSMLFCESGVCYDPHDHLKKYLRTPQDLNQLFTFFDPEIHTIADVLEKLFKDDPLLKKIFEVRLCAYEGSPPQQLALYHNMTTLEQMLIGSLALTRSHSPQKPLIHRMSLKGGNATLPLALAQKLSSNIHLDKALKRIDDLKNGKLGLLFHDGFYEECDQLILAIPCSVYDDIEFDEKILPATKLHFIKSVQYGSNGKILIPAHYPTMKYNAVMTNEMVAFFNQDNKVINMFYAGKSGASLYTNIDHCFKIALDAMKCSFEGAKFHTEDPIFAGDEQLISYDQPVAKSWMADSYAKGSYANYGLELQDKLGVITTYHGVKIKEIFTPIDDRLFFVGEHTTILDEIGTMEAAVESGERIATLFK